MTPFEALQRDAHAFVKVVNTEVFTQIIAATPVDTGRLRGNWQTTEGSPAQSVTERTEKQGGGAATEEARRVLSKGLGLFWLANNLPYAAVAEFGKWGTGPGATEKTTRDGYSVQAPTGMVRTTHNRIKGILQSVGTSLRNRGRGR